MPMTLSDHHIARLDRQLAELRSEQQHLGSLGRAADRRIEMLSEDGRRARFDLGDAVFRVEALVLLHLSLATIAAFIVILHALQR